MILSVLSGAVRERVASVSAHESPPCEVLPASQSIPHHNSHLCPRGVLSLSVTAVWGGIWEFTVSNHPARHTGTVYHHEERQCQLRQSGKAASRYYTLLKPPRTHGLRLSAAESVSLTARELCRRKCGLKLGRKQRKCANMEVLNNFYHNAALKNSVLLQCVCRSC